MDGEMYTINASDWAAIKELVGEITAGAPGIFKARVFLSDEQHQQVVDAGIEVWME